MINIQSHLYEAYPPHISYPDKGAVINYYHGGLLISGGGGRRFHTPSDRGS